MAGLTTAQLVLIAVVGFAAIFCGANWDKIKEHLPTWLGGTTAVPDIGAAMKAFFEGAKADVLQSAPSRSLCLISLTNIDTVVETFGNEADKAAAKEHIKGLASLLAVQPSPAAKA